LWLKHPVVRGKDYNVFAQIQYDAKTLEDRIATGLRTDRHLDNWLLSLSGNLRDSFLGSAVSAWGVGWTAGRVGFDDAAAASSDAASAQTRGGSPNGTSTSPGCRRWTGTIPSSSMWPRNGPIPTSIRPKKMSIGGPYSVRAYDVGAISGDTGYLASVELRRDMGRVADGNLQALAFIDSARVRINRRPWTTGDNSVSLSGIGVGLRWSSDSLWEASVFLATKVGSSSSSLLAASSSSRGGWLLARGSDFSIC
jgi:hemolysin activation/secretion protein